MSPSPEPTTSVSFPSTSPIATSSPSSSPSGGSSTATKKPSISVSPTAKPSNLVSQSASPISSIRGTSPTEAATSTPAPIYTITSHEKIPQVAVTPLGYIKTGDGSSVPVKIEIPVIGVSSKIISLGLDSAGKLKVPPDGSVAGYYTGAPVPGEIGPAIVVAHVDWNGKLGVFFHLKDLKVGERIVITRSDGRQITFGITKVQEYLKSEFPSQLVYGNLNYAGLRLVTCGGKFDPKAKSYLSNVIVFAKRLS